MAIWIPEAELARLKEHVLTGYPEEVCGLLAGAVPQEQAALKWVKRAVAVANVKEENRERRYLVDPKQYLQLEREVEREGLRVVGIYHSHPDHPARPSAFDLECAWPWFSYLIVGVSRAGIEDITSWMMKEDRSRFMAEPMTVTLEPVTR